MNPAKLKGDSWQELCDEFRRTSDVAVDLATAEAILARDGNDHIGKWVRDLIVESRVTRAFSLAALAAIGDRALPALEDCYQRGQRESVPRIRRQVLRALIRQPSSDPRGVALIVEGLTDIDQPVRARAQEALLALPAQVRAESIEQVQSQMLQQGFDVVRTEDAAELLAACAEATERRQASGSDAALALDWLRELDCHDLGEEGSADPWEQRPKHEPLIRSQGLEALPTCIGTFAENSVQVRNLSQDLVVQIAKDVGDAAVSGLLDAYESSSLDPVRSGILACLEEISSPLALPLFERLTKASPDDSPWESAIKRMTEAASRG